MFLICISQIIFSFVDAGGDKVDEGGDDDDDDDVADDNGDGNGDGNVSDGDVGDGDGDDDDTAVQCVRLRKGETVSGGRKVKVKSENFLRNVF